MSSSAEKDAEKDAEKLVAIDGSVAEPKLARRLMTPLLTKKVPPIPLDKERTTYPENRVNIISRIFFLWLVPLLNRGYKRTLQYNDLWLLDDETSIKTVYQKFEVNLAKLKTNKDTSDASKGDSLSRLAILRAILSTFKLKFALAVLYKSISNVCQVFSPLLIKYLIQNVEGRIEDPNLPINKGLGFAIGIALLLAFSALLTSHTYQNSKIIGAHSKSVLTKALLEKSLNANSKTKFEFPSGKVISMIGSDIAKLDLVIAFLPTIVTFPIPMVIGIALLISNIGVAALAGLALFIAALASLTIPAKGLMSLRTKVAKFTDERVGLTREILNSMKMIKFYSWEDAYEDKIVKVRNQEMSFVFRIQFIVNVVLSVIISLPTVTSLLAFLTLYSISPEKSPGTIFSSLALFNVLSGFVTEIPVLLSYLSAGLVSIDRISEFLEAPISGNKVDYGQIKNPKNALEIVDGDFEWDNSDGALTSSFSGLHNINLEAHKGEFIVVTGSIGSGKSSLLSAIARVMKKNQGEISVNGSLLFCGAPWVQNATIRDNILFGSDFDAHKYHSVLRCCALESDLKLFPAGDNTEIGERGVTLSGGQKARINLARAIYANKDIYLFDDILSAVDANVGKHIVENCFLKMISHKTRILATHQLSLVSKADKVVFLNGDGSIDVGTFHELSNTNDKFVSMMDYIKDASTNTQHNKQKDHIETKSNEIKSDASGALISAEERAIDSIPLSIYVQYLKAGQGRFGVLALPLLLFSISISVFVQIFANVWLSFWVDEKFNKPDGFYIGLYVMIVFASLFCLAIELGIMGYMITEASKNLNLNAIKKILHTPMSFIDTTPMGRILNRFTKDTNSLDNEIGERLKYLLHLTASIFGILILCVIYLPWFAIAIPIITAIFLLTVSYYQASSREVKRMEALRRSFVYNNFNEVLGGMNTIKAYHAEPRFIAKNDLFVDQLNEAYLVTIANQRWINIALDLTAASIALMVMLLSLFRTFKISAGTTGLITTSILELTNNLALDLVSYSEVENEMNSVERVCFYANNLEQEADYKIKETKPVESWPQHGAVEFKNVSFRYREGLPLVLKNLSFDLKSGEKLGICGRTGAGKSSLVSTLYRLSELSDGEIKIDGVAIEKLGLNDLRSKLSIIPQDPVLFQGTIRKNLDPFNERPDFELWDALKRSGLVNAEDLFNVNNKFHLDSNVEDDGANFSLGERQLLALARALVRSTKILIMDEATSSVDYKTDALVQDTIAREFKDCTVLCIAHRLKTILKYDKILVLEKGELEEFDEPIELFNKNGRFKEMCNSSNITENDFR